MAVSVTQKWIECPEKLKMRLWNFKNIFQATAVSKDQERIIQQTLIIQNLEAENSRLQKKLSDQVSAINQTESVHFRSAREPGVNTLNLKLFNIYCNILVHNTNSSNQKKTVSRAYLMFEPKKVQSWAFLSDANSSPTRSPNKKNRLSIFSEIRTEKYGFREFLSRNLVTWLNGTFF